MPRLFIGAGCPIRKSSAKLARQQTEAYRSLATSFIGLQRLGIHRAPLVALITTPLPPQPANGGFGAVGIPQVTLYSLVKVRSGFPPGLLAGRLSGQGVPGKWTAHEKAGLVADPLSTSPVLSLRYSVVKAVPAK